MPNPATGKLTKKEIRETLAKNGYNAPIAEDANLPALEAILEECKAKGVPHVVTAEDVKDNPEKTLVEGETVLIPWPTEGGESGQAPVSAPASGQEAKGTEVAPAPEKPATQKNGGPDKKEKALEASADMTVVAKSAIAHDHVDYAAGDKITLPLEAAFALIEAGVAEEAA